MHDQFAAGSVAVLVVASMALPVTAANAAPTPFTDALDIAGGTVYRHLHGGLAGRRSLPRAVRWAAYLAPAATM